MRFTPEVMAYEPPAEADFTKLIPIIGGGIEPTEMRGERPRRVKDVAVDETQVTFALHDGRKVSAPLEWYPRLKHATRAERNAWRLILGDRAVLWQALGTGIAAAALLEGIKANEPAASLRKWLSARKTNERNGKAGH